MKNLLTKSGGLTPHLLERIQDDYKNHLLNKWLVDDIKIALWCEHNNEKPKCKICINIPTFVNFKKGFGEYCSKKCYWDDMLGKPSPLTDEGRIIRSMKLKQSHLDGKHIVTDEMRIKMSESALSNETKNKKKETNLKKYGVENAGVLGAYSSKSAKEYILKFIEGNDIDVNRCMFKNDSEKEFFQMVEIPFLNKKRYVSYDLVVFNSVEAKHNKNMNEIYLILEYNGPWHYKAGDIIGRENEPSNPYKNAPFTKSQVIEIDYRKLLHVYKTCKRILVYWELKKTLEEWKPDLEIILEIF